MSSFTDYNVATYLASITAKSHCIYISYKADCGYLHKTKTFYMTICFHNKSKLKIR